MARIQEKKRIITFVGQWLPVRPREKRSLILSATEAAEKAGPALTHPSLTHPSLTHLSLTTRPGIGNVYPGCLCPHCRKGFSFF